MSDYTVKQLRAGSLEVDTTVQRSQLDEARVASIVAAFDPNAMGVISVSQRDTGRGERYVILDGWHRVAALTRLRGTEAMVDCHVYEGLDIQREARLFLALNHAKPVNSVDKFRVRVVCGDPVATRITAIVSRRGWKVSRSGASWTVSAVDALQSVYAMDGDTWPVEDDDTRVLAVVIDIITATWGGASVGARGEILRGIGLVVARHRATCDASKLIEALRARDPEPQSLVSAIATHSRSIQVSHAQAGYEVLVGRYNAGMRSPARKLR